MTKPILSITDTVSEFVQSHNDLVNIVGDKAFLNTTVDSDIVGAINSIDTFVGTLSSLTTDATGNLVVAINEVDANADSNAGDINTLFNNAGDLTNLTTTAQSNLVAAINEVDSDIGNISSLATTTKANLVASINEVSAYSVTNNTNIGTLGSLTTTAQSNLVAAINEVDSDVGVNTTNITTNANNISTNSTNITTNANNIATIDAKFPSSGTSFTPAITNTGTTPTYGYTAQTGFYYLLGDMVFFSIRIEMASVVGGGSGNVLITGLPFSNADALQVTCATGYVANLTGVSGADLAAYVEASTNYIVLIVKDAGALSGTAISPSAFINLSGWYKK